MIQKRYRPKLIFEDTFRARQKDCQIKNKKDEKASPVYPGSNNYRTMGTRPKKSTNNQRFQVMESHQIKIYQ